MSSKIVVIGPESTGKTTLSEDLAEHFRAALVPEFAREYINRLDRPYTAADLSEIARGQLEGEDLVKNNTLVICDTDLYVIKVWSEHAFGTCDPWILSRIAQSDCGLYLLTYIDVPWQEDPQREHPDPRMREYFYQQYKDIVVNAGPPWADIRGSRQQRLDRAMEAIQSLVKKLPDNPRGNVI